MLANGAVHFMHKLLFPLLLAGDSLLLSCYGSLFSLAFLTRRWARRSSLGLNVFSLGV